MEILKKNTGQKNIIEKVLSVLVDYESSITDYNNAIEDYNELGGIDAISEIMQWDEVQKKNWTIKIKNINSIK